MNILCCAFGFLICNLSLFHLKIRPAIDADFSLLLSKIDKSREHNIQNQQMLPMFINKETPTEIRTLKVFFYLRVNIQINNLAMFLHTFSPCCDNIYLANNSSLKLLGFTSFAVNHFTQLLSQSHMKKFT